MKNHTFCWVNDQQIRDLDIENMKALPSVLKNAGYEKTYRIRSVDDLKNILSAKDVLDNIRAILGKFSFHGSSCVFHYQTDEDILLDLMKESIDFQNKVFDDTTITYNSEQINDIHTALEYAKKKTDKPLAIYVPIDEGLDYVEEALNMATKEDRIKRFKLKYGKFSKYREIYSLVSKKLKDTNKSWHLSFCAKRCNLAGANNIGAEFIAQHYGADSVCHRWKEKPKDGRGWTTTTDVFQSRRLEYIRTPNEEVDNPYRRQRIENLKMVETEIGNMLALKGDGLIEYINGKPAFLKALTSLGVMVK